MRATSAGFSAQPERTFITEGCGGRKTAARQHVRDNIRIKAAERIPAPRKARGDSAHQRGGGVPLLRARRELIDGHRDRRVAFGYNADAAIVIFGDGGFRIERHRRGEDKAVLMIRMVAAKLRAPRRKKNVLRVPAVPLRKFCF